MSEARRPEEHGWSDEDLLQLLLESRTDELQRARADASVSARLADLEAFLGRWRDPLAALPGELPQGSESRLVRRVLARTTRLDPSWRGDVARVAGTVRDRLAQSPLLRCAAAVLVIGTLALPVLAWWVWSAPGRSAKTMAQVERPLVAPHVTAERTESQDALGRDTTPALSSTPGVPLPDAKEVERSLQAAAAALRSTTWPDAGQDQSWPRDLTLRWLAFRSKASSPAERLPPGSERDWRQSEGNLTGLERALRTELLLDRFALGDPDPPGLEEDLAALGTDAHVSDATRRIEALTLERGRAYGLVAPAASSRIAAAGVAVGSRASDPLDREWRAALRDALASDKHLRTALADASLHGWLEGNGRGR